MSNELGTEIQSRVESEKGMQLSKEMQGFVVQKLGINLEDIKDAITEPSFVGDLQNLMNNPENQTEKMIFLGKYIYDKIIAEAKKQGKDPVEYAKAKKESGEWTMKDYISFGKYNRQLQDQAAIDDDLRINGKKQGFIADNAKLGTTKETIEKNNTIEKNIKQYIEEAKGLLNQEGQSKLNEGIQEYKQDDKFIKELEGKGYSKEDIQSDKFNETIAGYYIARNADKFSAYVEDKEKFREANKNISNLLGLPIRIPDPINQIPKIIPPGDRQIQVLNTTNSLLDSGKYNPELTTYNSETGKITFRSKYNDDLTQIDTSKVPPVLEYSRSGLSISREIDPITPEQQEYKDIKLQSTNNNKLILTSEQEYAGIKGDILSQQSISYFREQNKSNSSISDIFTQKDNLEKEYTEAKSSVIKSEILGKLISLNNDLNSKRIQSINLTNTGTDLMRDTFEGVLEKEGLTLKTLKKQVDIQVELDRKLAKGNDKKSEGELDKDFENNAKATLSYLGYIGYNELGQDVLVKVINAINSHNKGQLNEINLSNNPKLDSEQEKELLRVLAQLSRKSSLMQSWQGVNAQDEIIAARQMSSPNWRASLQDIQKGVRFQSMKGGSQEEFTQYLYEQPQIETTSEK